MKRITGFAAALAAAVGLVASAPANASPGEIIDIIVGEGDLLDKLIALDADGIADMRDRIAEARIEIERAADDVRRAREDARSGRGNRFVALALSAVASEMDSVVARAIDSAYAEIDDAERRLADADVSADERDETQGAIDGLRADLGDIEEALARLMDELRN